VGLLLVATDNKGDARMEGDALAVGFCSGMAEPIATDGAHSKGQDVPQVAGGEFDARKGLGASGIAPGAVFPGERDSAVADSKHAGVEDGGAANVSAKVLNDAFAIAERLDRFGHCPASQPISLAARRFGSNAWRSFEIVPAWRISPLRPSSATAAVIIGRARCARLALRAACGSRPHSPAANRCSLWTSSPM
jgi:hypothetical protein